MSIFSYLDYFKFLNDVLKTDRKKRGLKKQLADAANCQASYFSLVLACKAHLTLEQAHGLCRFWRLSSDETDFFILMVNYARAGTPNLKFYFKDKLKKLKETNENLSSRIQNTETMTEADAAIYYSTWLYLAVHIMISIPNYQTEKAIAERLQVNADAVNRVLSFLEKLSLAEKQGTSWRSTRREFHLPKSSLFVGLHHGNWRRRAVDNAFLQRAEDLHYTSVSSVAKTDIEVLRAKLLAMIDESRKIIGPSNEEELICLSLDLFIV